VGTAAASLAIVGIVLAVALTSGGSSPNREAVRTIPWNRVPGLQNGPPPWNSSSAVLRDRLPLLGLHELTMEGAAIHIHQHLVVYVNGKQVTVPPEIGIAPADGFVTELHTHDATGIIHVESPTQATFTLGQFFCEWGVKLTANCLGRYRGPVSWWVSGRKMTGNPAQLVLQQHQEIVIATGQAPTNVPASFDFPAGL
jgi:hypothetical protein